MQQTGDIKNEYKSSVEKTWNEDICWGIYVQIKIKY
jgi:hypothetical protein